MARIFSININFENQDFTVLVSLRETGNDIHCMVRYIDEGLQYIIPGDCIEFSFQEGLKLPAQLPTELARNLVKSTTTALADYYSLKD